jgi:hypothetical protein
MFVFSDASSSFQLKGRFHGHFCISCPLHFPIRDCAATSSRNKSEQSRTEKWIHLRFCAINGRSGNSPFACLLRAPAALGTSFAVFYTDSRQYIPLIARSSLTPTFKCLDGYRIYLKHRKILKSSSNNSLWVHGLWFPGQMTSPYISEPGCTRTAT